MNATEPPGGKKSGSSKIRTFIAVKLPDPVIRMVAGWQQELKRHALRIKWTRPENIHLTLKFLGDIATEDVAPVCAAVDTSIRGLPPMTLCAKGVGVFPGIRQARVLWTGISGETDLLANVHQAIDVGLRPLGFALEQRRFKGHLTLGRFKGRADADILIDVMKTYAAMVSDEFRVTTVYVIKSDLKPSGPLYTDLSRIQLV